MAQQKEVLNRGFSTNSSTKIFMLAIFFLLTIKLSAALDCSLTQTACNKPGESLILCLSDETNAHAEIPQTVGGVARCPNYDWKLCCTGGVTSECKENNQIAWLVSPTNSHASQTKDDTYSIPVCINGLRETKCSTSSFSSAACVLSFSGSTNAHLARCNSDGYSNKIYCLVDSDHDQDTYAADVDCDDDNKNVHPAAEEIGDGLDNDCDGLLDGDDPDLLVLPKGWYQVSAEADKEKFASYTAGGVEVQTLETGQKVFTLTYSGRKGIASKKVKIEKNKEYVARITSSCEATLQLVFDDALAEKKESGPLKKIFLQFFPFLFDPNLINSVTGKDALSVTANSQNAEHASIFIDVKEKDCQLSDPQLDLKGKVQPVEYNDALQPRALPIEPTTTFASAACCPENRCWNGFSCVENMRDQTFISETVTEKAVYQCLDGNWVFRAKLYDWNNQKSGSCPQEGQCFVLSSKEASPEAKAADFYQGKYPLCVNNGEYIFDHYCSDGTWLTRTQFAARQLLKTIPAEDDFTLYCTTPEDALVSLDNQEQIILGNPSLSSSPAASDGGNLPAAGSGQPTGGPSTSGLLSQQKKAPIHLCFPDLSGSGKILIDDTENTCINNVCLLQDEEGKIAFATTLNQKIDDVAASFVQSLGISPENFLQSCKGEEEYKTCVVEGLSGKIYYSEKMNALIYSKGSLSFESDESAAALASIIPADKAVAQIYLLKKGDKTAQALVEDYGKNLQGIDNQILKANYSGFATPICLFAEHLATPTSAGKGVLGGLAGESGFICTTKEEVQEVVATKDIGYLWPQLTGKLRVEKFDLDEINKPAE